MDNFKAGKYTADEIIDLIQSGWKSHQEWIELENFVQKAPMEERELEKLRESGWLDMLVHAE